MLTFLFSLPGKIAMAALVIVLAYGGGYIHGRTAGANKSAMTAFKDTLKDYGVWDDASNEIDGLDAVARCVELGGLPDDCRTSIMRGKEAAPSE